MYSKQKQLGKKKKSRTAINRIANKKLAQMQIDHDIRHCELCSTTAITNAHKHKRVWYYDKPESTLWDYNQVVWVCMEHHNKMESDKKYTEQVFKELRK